MTMLPSPLRVIVCGSTEGVGADVVERALGSFDRDGGRLAHVIVCSLTGVDADAWRWAFKHNRACSVVPAEWGERGKAAGDYRNERIFDLFKVHALLAFPGGRDTREMVDFARRKGIRIWHCQVRGEHWQWKRQDYDYAAAEE